MKDLKGRTALVTGASGGLGTHIARGLAREGMNVVVSGRREDALAAVVDELSGLGVKARAVSADLSDLSRIDPLIDRCEAELGPIDLLVNNAGVETTSAFTSYAREELTSIVDINLTAPLLLTHRLVPGMLSRGYGHVVFISSAAGKLGPAYQEPYAATKAAINALVRAIAARGVPQLTDRLLGRVPRLHRRRWHVPADGRAGLQVQPPDGRDHDQEGHRQGH